MADVASALRQQGHALKRIDFGGGLGVVYKDETPPDLKAYASAVRAAVKGLGLDLIVEPDAGWSPMRACSSRASNRQERLGQDSRSSTRR